MRWSGSTASAGWIASKLLLVSVSSLVWVAAFEVLARSWIGRFGDPLDQSIAVLRMDPYLGWRQKERFRGTFQDVPLETNELGLRNAPLSTVQELGTSILILGPSSTFGWGVPEESTYARQLERLLGRPPTKMSVSVINAGEIGFSSWQGLEFYRRELRTLQPALLIIAYGANDVDRHRFFFDDPLPDHVTLAHDRSPASVAWQNAVGRLRFFHVARRGAARVLHHLSCAATSRASLSQRGIPSVRVPPQHYTDNLRTLIALARQDGAEVLLMTTGFQLPAFPQVSAQHQADSSRLLERGLQHLAVGEERQALEALSGSLQENPHQCETHYALSFLYGTLGDCAAARQAVHLARAAEPARLERDLRTYNRLVREVATETEVSLVDVEVLLAGLHPEALFLDSIHLTPEGHRRLAHALRETILERGVLN